MKKLSYKHTVSACYVGYVIQAMVCNFAPLLFVTISNDYNISLAKLTLIITVTFTVQMLVDVISARYVDKIGYRISMAAAHVLSAGGFILLSFLPNIMPPYPAIIIAVLTYSVGSGLLEVLISPVVESCPTKNKKGSMAFLHSFYCWGSVMVILFSTIFFAVFGRENWRILSLLWAVIPAANGLYFMFVPMYHPIDDEQKIPVKSFAKSKIFILLILMMITAGASEVAMSQWASSFAETGLHVSKTIGDLAGPCMFAVLMGTARVFYSFISKKIDLLKYMCFCAILCVASYLIASLSASPVIALAACALCGFSVGVLWPGTISIAAKRLGRGGTPLFAFLAMAGDVGCTLGPTVIGFTADLTGGLKQGLMFGALFPVMLLIVACFLAGTKKSKSL